MGNMTITERIQNTKTGEEFVVGVPVDTPFYIVDKDCNIVDLDNNKMLTLYAIVDDTLVMNGLFTQFTPKILTIEGKLPPYLFDQEEDDDEEKEEDDQDAESQPATNNESTQVNETENSDNYVE